MEDNITYKYYIVGDRPVKAKYKDKKLKGFYALNYETGDFELNQKYLSKIQINRNPLEVDELSEKDFNDKVQENLKQSKIRKKARVSFPGM